MSRYKSPAIKLLTDQQVRYTPRDVRLEQIDRAEALVGSLQPQESYSYPDLCEQITQYRPESGAAEEIPGEDVVHDLRCFIEDLSDSVDLAAEEAGEDVLTLEDVSRRYNVSTKTVDRWRNRGLVSRRFLFGGRKRIGFLSSSVDRFVAQHAEDVERGTNFRQLTEEEREEIIRRARRLAKHGACPTEIARRLGRRFGRSPETIRLTLKNYDRHQPAVALFPESSDPLSEADRRDIYNSSKRGVSIDELAARYHRTKSSLYRIMSEYRAARLMEQPIDFIDSVAFHEPDADEKILHAPVPTPSSHGVTKSPPGLPPYLASLYAVPLLSREEEAYYFAKMNYLKMKAGLLRKELDPHQPRAKQMDEIEDLLSQATTVKNFLIRSNLRLVVSIAKKHMKPNTSFFEMVSDGNMSLIRAIEKFDYSRGFKFSTYATWAIMKNFARSIPAEHNQLDRFRTGSEEVFQQSTDQRTDQFHQEMVNSRQHEVLVNILDRLESREREIIVQRYGLEEGVQPQTLEQVGQRFGVTKERIRQIEARALKKLKQIAVQDKLDIPGI